MWSLTSEALGNVRTTCQILLHSNANGYESNLLVGYIPKQLHRFGDNDVRWLYCSL